MCHKIKHIGFWLKTPRGLKKLKKLGLTPEDLIEHFCEVNNCSKKILENIKKKPLKYGEKEVSMIGNKILESMNGYLVIKKSP